MTSPLTRDLVFAPVFVFDSTDPSSYVKDAWDKGFKMVDIREPGCSIYAGSPHIVVFDMGADAFTINQLFGPRNFNPPKSTAVMTILQLNKGTVRGLPDRTKFIEWFFGKKVKYFNPINGKFRV